MYRVLMTFALINAFLGKPFFVQYLGSTVQGQMLIFDYLVLVSFLALLFLAIRKYRKGDNQMWYAPVTSCAWFHHYGQMKQPPAKKVKSTVLPIANGQHMHKTMYTPEPERKASVTRRDRSTRPYYTRNPYPTPPKPYTTNMPRHARRISGSSPYYSGSSIVDIEKGGMLNPKSTRRS